MVPGEPHFRAFPRRLVKLPAILRADVSGAHPGYVVNISLGGACVEVPLPNTYSVGSTVTLELTASSLWDPLLMHAFIRWVKASPDAVRTGLAFQHRDARSLPALMKLLTSYRDD